MRAKKFGETREARVEKKEQGSTRGQEEGEGEGPLLRLRRRRGSEWRQRPQLSAIVTSTSTPGSMEMEVICLRISEGEWSMMIRLWMRIW